MIARMVEGNDVSQAVALRRGILDVPHVQIKPAAVEQETAVARRFFIIPIVQINRAEARDLEDVVLDPDRKRIGAALPVLVANQAAVLGRQPDDAIHKSFSALRTSFSSSRRNFLVGGRLRSNTAASTWRVFR